MKRGTPDHPKLRRLARRLGLPKYATVGVLEALWHFAQRYAPTGDVGRYTDQDLADALEWDRDAGEIIAALVAERWLDEHETHRLVVHDWPDHVDDATHKALARARERFADGRDPNWRRLSGDERKQAEEFYAQPPRAHAERPPGARRAPCHSHSPALAMPRQSPAPPEPMPEPEPRQSPPEPEPAGPTADGRGRMVQAGSVAESLARPPRRRRSPAELVAWVQQELGDEGKPTRKLVDIVGLLPEREIEGLLIEVRTRLRDGQPIRKPIAYFTEAARERIQQIDAAATPREGG